MSEELNQYIAESMEKGFRIDGRKLDQFRDIKIETDVVATAEGSARVTCGDTEVLAGVKMSMGTPYGDTPEDGVLMVGAELLPMSNPNFESGPPSVESIELARVIDRGVREGKMIDTKKLCIEKGEKVWMVSVDICPINADGNLLDIGALAVVAAIKSAKFPAIKDDAVDYKTKTKDALPIQNVPVTVTVFKIGDNLVVDPSESEEKAYSARLTLEFLEDGNLCAMQKGGSSPLTEEDVSAMIELAKAKSEELRKKL